MAMAKIAYQKNWKKNLPFRLSNCYTLVNQVWLPVVCDLERSSAADSEAYFRATNAGSTVVADILKRDPQHRLYWMELNLET
jgi:hypothetical protein